MATLCFFSSQDIQRSTERGTQEWIFVLARLISALQQLYNYGANSIFLCPKRGCSRRSDSHLKGMVWTKMNNLDLFVNVKKPHSKWTHGAAHRARASCRIRELSFYREFKRHLCGLSQFYEDRYDVGCSCMIFSFIHFSSLNAWEENSAMLFFFLKSLQKSEGKKNEFTFCSLKPFKFFWARNWRWFAYGE